MSKLERTDRDVILLHAAFAVACLLVLAIPSGIPAGQRLCGLVLLYNVSLPLAAWRRGHPEWLDLWLFLLPLSALQVFPDWFLSAQLGVLVFPDTGSTRIGAVPAFMAGLWTIPLFVVVLLGRRVASRSTRKVTLLVVAAASLLLFVGSEATLWSIPIWYARDVTTVAHVALYLIVPETLLGLSAFLAFESSLRRPSWYKLGAAFVVMLIYLGAACFFYFVLEGLLWA